MSLAAPRLHSRAGRLGRSVLPIGVAFIHRMNVEENAFSGALGTQYTDYMRRTKRLVPFIY